MSMLIVGGTSGLGLELARNAAADGQEVIVAGRHDPEVDLAQYREFDLTGGDLPARVGRFVMNLPPVESLVYAAGFYQEGHVTDLTDEQIDDMIDVCGRGVIFFVKKLLEKQGELEEFALITSTSQWVPRELEPVYNFAKAGAAHFARGVSLDPALSKTLIVGTSGMATPFWDRDGRDTSHMLDPAWVAGEIDALRDSSYRLNEVKILGPTGDLPKRVEKVE